MLGLSLWSNMKKSHKIIIPDYQPWETYPDSPILTINYPYQMIIVAKTNPDVIYLFASEAKLYNRLDGTTNYVGTASGKNLKRFYKASGSNVYTNEITVSDTELSYSSAASGYTLTQANNDIYTDNSFGSVYFDKTT